VEVVEERVAAWCAKRGAHDKIIALAWCSSQGEREQAVDKASPESTGLLSMRGKLLDRQSV